MADENTIVYTKHGDGGYAVMYSERNQRYFVVDKDYKVVSKMYQYATSAIDEMIDKNEAG